MRYEAVLPETVHEKACNHLLQHVREGKHQEDLCFALWRPSSGYTRRSAIIFEIIPPLDGERELHGNASFDSAYLARAAKTAREHESGLAFMHNHFTAGWQDMSNPDVVAERDRISPVTRITGLPLVGLTLGADGSWSARFWNREGHQFNHHWCDKVRVVGSRLRLTYHEDAPRPKRKAKLRRTIDTWGEKCQNDIARLRIGIVGVGSVGCIIAEALARIGVESVVLIDPDKIETHNLDRLLYAGDGDVGKDKVALAAQHLKRSATAENFNVVALTGNIQEEGCYRVALDCDLLFSAVDRPLPKDLLNRIAYAHCIPVISGGVYIHNKESDGTLAQAHWSVLSVGPGKRCLRCDGQYTSSDVVMERDGSLDDPSYIANMGEDDEGLTNQNVFPFSANLASFMVIEMIRILIADDWWKFAGGKIDYKFISGELTSEKAECNKGCSISERVAYGDKDVYPFLIESENMRETITQKSVRRIKDFATRFLARFMGKSA